MGATAIAISPRELVSLGALGDPPEAYTRRMIDSIECAAMVFRVGRANILRVGPTGLLHAQLSDKFGRVLAAKGMQTNYPVLSAGCCRLYLDGRIELTPSAMLGKYSDLPLLKKELGVALPGRTIEIAEG
jgi:hypothetical protein